MSELHHTLSRRSLLFGLTGALAVSASSLHARPAVSLKDFGAAGNGLSDDSEPWHQFLRAALRHGEGFIPAGHYRLDKLKPFAPRGDGLRLIGEGSNDVLLEGKGGKHSKAFSLVDASLDISGISTKNISLIEAHRTIARDIPHLTIKDWRWHNDAKEGLRALSIFSPFGDVPYKIDQVKLSSIFGSGGVCGLWLRTAMRHCDIDDVEIRNIVVPNNKRWYYQKRPTRMNDIGTACGLLIGDDTTDAQAQFERCDIDRVIINGVRDHRILKDQSSDPANCDGIRILAQNVRFNDLTISNVSNHARRDCTGLYTKVVEMEGQSLTITNAGHHEASLTMKGSSASNGKKGARGENVRLKQVSISNTEGFVGRPAVYLSCDNVAIQSLDVFGCGGDVEDPYDPGQRIPGASAVVRLSPSLNSKKGLGRAAIDRLVMKDCVLGGISERWAVSLGGYREIYLGEVICSGLSNAGRFRGQGIDDGQDLSILTFSETVVPCDQLTIKSILAQDCHAPGREAQVLSFLGKAPLKRVSLGSIKSDQTFTRQLEITGSQPIERFDWDECNPRSIKIETPPISGALSSATNRCL